MSGCAPKTPLALATAGLNRGVGFTHEERHKLGLTGRLPSGVLSLDQQAERVWRQLQSMPTDGAGLLPDVTNLRVVSAVVAEAVYHASVADGVATKRQDNVVQAILDAMWVPEYKAEIQ